ATAMITVAVIWFGIGEGSKIFLIIYTTVFIVIINTAAGVSAVPINKIRAARSLGAGSAQVFFYVALPATVPYILTGSRLAMANSFVTIIAAELVAANNGLGKMIWDSRLYMLVDQIFVALLVLGLLGFTADRLFRWAIDAFAGRFSPATWGKGGADETDPCGVRGVGHERGGGRGADAHQDDDCDGRRSGVLAVLCRQGRRPVREERAGRHHQHRPVGLGHGAVPGQQPGAGGLRQ